MNTIAGSVTFRWTIDINDFTISNILDIRDKVGNIFIYWKTVFQTSSEVLEYIKSKIQWDIIRYDISISTEDYIEVLTTDIDRTKSYLLRTFEWLNIDYAKVKEMVANDAVISIREAEESTRFWNRIIKVDSFI